MNEGKEIVQNKTGLEEICHIQDFVGYVNNNKFVFEH